MADHGADRTELSTHSDQAPQKTRRVIQAGD